MNRTVQAPLLVGICLLSAGVGQLCGQVAVEVVPNSLCQTWGCSSGTYPGFFLLGGTTNNCRLSGISNVDTCMTTDGTCHARPFPQNAALCAGWDNQVQSQCWVKFYSCGGVPQP